MKNGESNTVKLNFTILHRGFSFRCVAWLRNTVVAALGLDSDAGAAGAPRAWHDDRAMTKNDEAWRTARDQVNDKLHLVTDLLHSGVTWTALSSCKNTANLLGNIIDTVERRRRMEPAGLEGLARTAANSAPPEYRKRHAREQMFHVKKESEK